MITEARNLKAGDVYLLRHAGFHRRTVERVRSTMIDVAGISLEVTEVLSRTPKGALVTNNFVIGATVTLVNEVAT